MSTILGTSRRDTLLGTDDSDVISGLAGSDYLEGGGGSDFLYGGGESDTLHGGEGNDLVLGGPGLDLITGGTGNDTLNGGGGIDIVSYLGSPDAVTVSLSTGTGGLGEALGDVLVEVEDLIGTLYRDTLVGNDVANTIYASGGGDEIWGMGGNDFISAALHPTFGGGMGFMTTDVAHFYGGEGNDTIWGDPSPGSATVGTANIFGGSGDDMIYSGSLVRGGTGNDYVYAGNIPSLIYGDAGNDTVEATYGNHTVHGGTGDDIVWTDGLHGGSQVVYLEAGNDVAALYMDGQAEQHFFGGLGIDTFFYGPLGGSGSTSPRIVLDALNPGADRTLNIGVVTFRDFERLELNFFNERNDIILMGQYDDAVSSAGGADLLSGRGGNDFLNGESGADTLFGGEGDDALIAGAGVFGAADVANGGAGNDIIWGNFGSADYRGETLMTGGEGVDAFAFIPVGTYTPDTVTDFVPGTDHVALYFSNYSFVDPGDHDLSSFTPTHVFAGPGKLEFQVEARVGEGGYEFHQIQLRYSYTTGGLFYRDLSGNGDTEFRNICLLRNAPHLTLTDFVQVDELL